MEEMNQFKHVIDVCIVNKKEFQLIYALWLIVFSWVDSIKEIKKLNTSGTICVHPIISLL